MEITVRALNELRPYAHNPKTHPKSQVDNIARSIQDFGFRQPLVIDGDGSIVCGHGRYLAAAQLGMTELPCVMADDLTPAQIRAYRILDNKIAESPWSYEALELELPQIDLSGYDLRWHANLELPQTLEEAPVPESAPGRCSPGDILALGQHRLLCGDSTRPEDIQRLMGEERADLLLTDPPYNADYEGVAGKLLNDSMPSDRFAAFLESAFSNAKSVMRPGAAFFIWYSSMAAYEFHGACRKAGLKAHQVLVWVKQSMILSRQDFNWQHELCLYGSTDKDPDCLGGEDHCLYGWKEGAAHTWCKNDKQSTVLRFDRPAKSKLHPTMKPMDMIGYQISCVTHPGQLVLDLFGGSGTTLMACEKLGRCCRMMELSPKFCDVIIKRWEEMTGDQAIRIE